MDVVALSVVGLVVEAHAHARAVVEVAEAVEAGAAVDVVGAEPGARDHLVAAELELVVAGAAVDRVVAAFAGDLVGAAVAGQAVGAGAALEDVVARAAVDGVRGGAGRPMKLSLPPPRSVLPPGVSPAMRHGVVAGAGVEW